MIKDQLLKYTFMLLAGIVVPLLAGLFSHVKDDPLLVFLTVLLFSAAAFATWLAVVTSTVWLRKQEAIHRSISVKQAVLPATGALVGALTFLVAWLVYKWAFLPGQTSSFAGSIVTIGAVGGALLSLVLEVAFLSRQDRLDYTVRQPVEEKPIARSSELKNELDPHFFFNCMNTLSYLVRNDAEKAWQFVHKLSNVYKYFLRNKEKSLVPLHEEMEFLDNYLFLLQVRFDDNILVTKNLNAQNGVSILPCTLQVLVENAIKHNFFSEKEPLVISIEQNGSFLHVSNPMRPKVHASESVESGLRNLQTRYRVLAQQQVILQKANSRFLVKLPIVKTISHDKSSDH